MGVAPGVVIGNRQYVGFQIDLSSAVPGCCQASLVFDEDPSTTWAVLPREGCPSTNTDPVSGTAGRHFRATGAYTVTLVARTCLLLPTVPGDFPKPGVEGRLVVCLRVVLDGSGTTSSRAGPCG